MLHTFGVQETLKPLTTDGSWGGSQIRASGIKGSALKCAEHMSSILFGAIMVPIIE